MTGFLRYYTRKFFKNLVCTCNYILSTARVFAESLDSVAAHLEFFKYNPKTSLFMPTNFHPYPNNCIIIGRAY
jgi:hypothetical protein